jgi:hypothetical protein
VPTPPPASVRALSSSHSTFSFSFSAQLIRSIEKAHTPKIKFYYNDLKTFSHLREQQK